MVFWISADESNTFRLRRRNAADTADIWGMRISSSGGARTTFLNFALRLNLAVNEFVVIENAGAGNAGVAYQASIFVNAG